MIFAKVSTFVGSWKKNLSIFLRVKLDDKKKNFDCLFAVRFPVQSKKMAASRKTKPGFLLFWCTLHTSRALFVAFSNGACLPSPSDPAMLIFLVARFHPWPKRVCTLQNGPCRYHRLIVVTYFRPGIFSCTQNTFHRRAGKILIFPFSALSFVLHNRKQKTKKKTKPKNRLRPCPVVQRLNFARPPTPGPPQGIFTDS